MARPTFETLKVGDSLPAITVGPITRTTLALYCGASGDHNPLHVDIDFAKKAGLPDVIAHGMLSMAYLGRVVTGLAPVDRVRTYNVRFAAMTKVGETVTCSGRIAEKLEVEGEKRVRIELEARATDGAITLQGDAVVVL